MNRKLSFYIGICVGLLFVYGIFTLLTPQSDQILQPDERLVTPYQKSQVNKSTDAEVRKIPTIKSITKRNETQTTYTLHSSSPLRDNIIVTESGKVIYEKAITGSSKSPHPQVKTFIATFGEPEQKVQGSKIYGEFETFYIYASKGFTLVANPFTGEIDEIQSYVPTTVTIYLSTWGDDYAPEVRQHSEEAEYRP